MKITSITTEDYSWPRPRPITNGKHTYTHLGLNLLKIETDENVVGIGLGTPGSIVKATIEHLKPLLIGEDPLNVERLWHKMWVPKLIGRRGITTRAISAIDIGLWDIRAKVAGMPLYKLLGGYQDSVPTYVAGGYYEDDKGLKELAQEMESYVEMGARGVKMKVGAVSIREDVERVRAVREAIGPDIKLLIDANCAYKTHEAIQFARRIEDFDPFWFEEPISPDNYDGHRRIADSTIVPIATGENEYTRYGFRDLIAAGGVAVFNADAKILGGVTEWMKVNALAQAHEIDVAPHGSQDIHVHLVACASNGLILEFYPERIHPLASTMYHHTLELNHDGTVSPPDVPGIGVDPNYEVLEQYRIA